MKKMTDKIIKNHIKQIKSIDNTQSIPKMVKNIDSITQQTLRELYNLIDIRKDSIKMDKKGHCC
jgi:CRISPR/Cas system CSM-associated protein Csm2 small subunit